MRKLISVILCVVFALSLCVFPAAAEDTALSDDIVILYTNDIHTYIDKDLGYDVLAGLKKNLQTQYKNVLLVDAGDHIQGTAYGFMDKGKTIIEMMNAAGYDAATLGNHEFDYGMDGCENIRKWAEFPYISCNFYRENQGVRGENVLDSYVIFECGGTSVALVGITTPTTITSSTPTYFQDGSGNYIYGFSKEDAIYKDVQAAVDKAKAAGADIVIGLGHLGDDMSCSPYTSEETIANVTGLSAFIDGHSHSTVEGKAVKDKAGETVVLTQTGEYFQKIGMMVIAADTGKITTKLLTKEDLKDIQPDRGVAKIKTDWIAQVDTQMGVTIGSAEVTFDNYQDGKRLVRSQETNTGDFAADALYYLFDSMGMEVDVAIMNGGGVRNKAITGTLTYKAMKEIHTFGNVACLQAVTGQQILDALEWGARFAGSGEESGGFLQVSGLTYRIDTQWPDTTQKNDKEIWTGGPTGGYRVHSVKIYNKETGTWDALDLSATYHLAGYNYTLRNMGDGFNMFQGAENVLDYVMEDYMVLANYVQAFENGVVGATNSPLAKKYPGFTVDYGSINGSGRIVMAQADRGSSPQTGDAFPLTVAVSVAVLSAAAVVLLCPKKKKAVK